MTVRIEIGAGTRPPDRPGRRPVATFREIESSGENLIRTATVRRWRDRAAADWQNWSFVALHWLSDDPLQQREPPKFAGAESGWGMLRQTKANQLLWERFLHPFGADGPYRVLFRTPPSFTPSQENRDALAAVAEEWCAPAGITMEWEPAGLWSPGDALEQAAELGAVTALDPFADYDLPPDSPLPVIYKLDRPRGGRVRFTEDDVFELLEHIAMRSAPVRIVARGPNRDQTIGLIRRCLRFTDLEETLAGDRADEPSSDSEGLD